MPNPYELTALEDPADMYNELPRGGGRIAFPSGDVRSFQFEPPTPEDQNAALRAAAARAQQFDVLQRNAQQAALDKQEMEDLQANLRVENAAKAVQMAERFQARRAYEREMQAAESEGLTSLQAGARAGARVPSALGDGGGSGAAAMNRAAADAEGWIPEKIDTEIPDVEVYRTGFRGQGLTAVRGQKEDVSPKTKAKSRVIESKIDAVNRALMDSFLPESKRADLETKLATYERELEDLYTPTSPPADVDARRIPKTGDVVKGYRFNGNYPPSDKRAWEKAR